MDGNHKPWSWLNTPAYEGASTFSPDGKWIVYTSNESGRNEIYFKRLFLVLRLPAANDNFRRVAA